MKFTMTTKVCPICDQTFTYKRYRNLNERLYCSRKCNDRKRGVKSRPNYHSQIEYTPHHDWDVIGYDLCYLIDIHDQLTDEECSKFGEELCLSKELYTIKTKGYVLNYYD